MKTFNGFLNENNTVDKSRFSDCKFKVGDKVICVDHKLKDSKLYELPVTIMNIVCNKENGIIYYMLWNENGYRGYFTDKSIWDNPLMYDYWYYQEGSNSKRQCFWSDEYGTDLVSDTEEESNFEAWLEESNKYEWKYQIGDRVTVRNNIDDDYINYVIDKTSLNDEKMKSRYVEVMHDIIGESGVVNSISSIEGKFFTYLIEFDNESLNPYYYVLEGLLKREEDKDLPEETNYEEWVEEMNRYGFEVGDVVIVYDGESAGNRRPYVQDMVGTIESIRENGNVRVKPINLQLIKKLDKEYTEQQEQDSFLSHTTFNLGQEYENTITLRPGGLRMYIDKPEETNYEEWVEESSDLWRNIFNFSNTRQPTKKIFRLINIDEKRHFQLGDKIIYDCVNKFNSLTIGKVYKVIGIERRKDYWDTILIHDNLGRQCLEFEKCFKKVDDFEETNYEEWIEENLDHKFKKGDKVFIPKKKTLGITGSSLKYEQLKSEHPDVFELPYWTIKDITKHNCCDFVEFTEPWWPLIDLVPYEDEPEDTNYEEWLGEGYERGFLVGDRVKILEQTIFPIELKFLVGKTGTIIRLLEYHFCVVEFDEQYNRLIEYNNKMHNYAGFIQRYLKQNPDKKNVYFFPSKVLIPIEDSEDTNYEEWLEESLDGSKSIGCKKGDLVKSKENVGEFLTKGKVYTCTTDEKYSGSSYSVFVIDDRNDNSQFWSDRFVIIDDIPEDSNMEEWNEKRIIKYEEF